MVQNFKKCIAITGASSGIGAALAKFYAAQGFILELAGRNEKRLETVTNECRKMGANATGTVVDVTQLEQVKEWVADANRRQTIDIIHVNAGVTGGVGPEQEFETPEDVDALISTNLIGATHTIGVAVQEMLQIGKGQIVVTNSLASYVGFKGSPAYCASKAGLRIYCESLQRSLKPKGIAVTLVYPGYVESPMSRKVIAPKPMTKTAEDAARLIAIATQNRKRQMGFPYLLWVGVRLLSILPNFAQNIFIPLFDWKMDMRRE